MKTTTNRLFVRKLVAFVTLGILAAVALPKVIAAASPGFDQFEFPVCLVASSNNLTTYTGGGNSNNIPNLSGAVTVNLTNAPLYTRGLLGTAKLDIAIVNTNIGVSMTGTFFSSTDLTNWTQITNFAIITNGGPTNIVVTNQYNGYNTVSTNFVLRPFTVVNPSAAAAGWTSPNAPQSPPYTNSSVTLSTNGYSEIGFLEINSYGPYLREVWTPSQPTTNVFVASFLTAAHTQ